MPHQPAGLRCAKKQSCSYCFPMGRQQPVPAQQQLQTTVGPLPSVVSSSGVPYSSTMGKLLSVIGSPCRLKARRWLIRVAFHTAAAAGDRGHLGRVGIKIRSLVLFDDRHDFFLLSFEFVTHTTRSGADLRGGRHPPQR